MATYKPYVYLSWKYIENNNQPLPNLKVVYDANVEVETGEKLTYTVAKASVTHTVVTILVGTAGIDSIHEEWTAPFVVSYNKDENDENKALIRREIGLNQPVTVTTVVMKDGQVNEVVSQSSQNATIHWD